LSNFRFFKKLQQLRALAQGKKDIQNVQRGQQLAEDILQRKNHHLQVKTGAKEL
jgi:hypothetical protein